MAERCLFCKKEIGMWGMTQVDKGYVHSGACFEKYEEKAGRVTPTVAHKRDAAANKPDLWLAVKVIVLVAFVALILEINFGVEIHPVYQCGAVIVTYRWYKDSKRYRDSKKAERASKMHDEHMRKLPYDLTKNDDLAIIVVAALIVLSLLLFALMQWL